MKKKTILTYQDHLDHLAAHPQNNAWDYGVYMKESRMVDSFAKQSSTVIFLLDFSSKTYPLIGKNVHQIMGHPHDAFLEGGLDFMLHQHKDFEVLNKKMFPDETRETKNVAPNELSQLRFSKSYRFKNQQGKFNTILQRNTIINSGEQNVPVVIFGFAWDITHLAEKGKIIHEIEKYDKNTCQWVSLLSKEYYPDVDPNQLLSKREIEILKWSIEGNSSKQIADKLHISFNTVNTHRRNMLRRTNCNNSMELLCYAIENKLL